MRERNLFLFLCFILAALPGHSQTPVCEALQGPKRELARRLLDTEHLYDCCDKTISACLGARPTCALAVQLANNVCRRVALGQDEVRIRRALSRRARSMVGGGALAAVDFSQAPITGPPDAPVTVTVFACARCPYCSKLVPALYEEIQSGQLKGQVRMAFRTFPIKGHAGSTEAGLAFTAAYRMGRFWEFALYAYRHFDEFSAARQLDWAKTIGLDAASFSAQMAAPDTREMLVASKKEGIVNQVEETPTLFINGRRWVGDLDAAELLDALQEEAARKRGETWLKQ